MTKNIRKILIIYIWFKKVSILLPLNLHWALYSVSLSRKTIFIHSRKFKRFWQTWKYLCTLRRALIMTLKHFCQVQLNVVLGVKKNYNILLCHLSTKNRMKTKKERHLQMIPMKIVGLLIARFKEIWCRVQRCLSVFKEILIGREQRGNSSEQTQILKFKTQPRGECSVLII